MQYKNTFDFAPLAVGTMRLGDWGAKMNTSQIESFIEGCLELGLTDFDHADIYGGYTTEADFGEVLKNRSGLKDQIKLITKCGIKMMSENRPQHHIKSYDLGAEHIRASVDQSLKSLNVDKIDLLLLHRPDLLIDPHEIATEFEELKKQGKVLQFGVSNFSPAQFDLLNSFTPLVTNQVEVSITHLDAFGDGTLDQSLTKGLRPMAWSPLGGGGIMGSSSDARINRIQATGSELAQKYNASLDQILLAWLLRHPAGIIPVLGTSKLNRVASALKSTEINLSREEWYQLLEASTGEEVA